MPATPRCRASRASLRRCATTSVSGRLLAQTETSPDAVAAWPALAPTATDWLLGVTLDDDDFAQFVSPLELSLQTSAAHADPWSTALEGVKRFLKAASDAPVGCNDAFVALAQAAKDGPDAMRHGLNGHVRPVVVSRAAWCA